MARKWRCNGEKEKTWRGSKYLSLHFSSSLHFPILSPFSHSLSISFPFSRLLSIFSFSRHFLASQLPSTCALCRPGFYLSSLYLYTFPVSKESLVTLETLVIVNLFYTAFPTMNNATIHKQRFKKCVKVREKYGLCRIIPGPPKHVLHLV